MMDDRQAGRIWDQNAETWIELAREGYDVFRDEVNTPAFLEFLPDVQGLEGLDLGCGEGHNTRLLSARGAKVTAIDIAPRFVAAAREEERREPMGVRYSRASALALPFGEAAFDFVAAFMSLMDVADQSRAVAEVHRVLRPDGFLQFSINHPCFVTPRWEWVLDRRGELGGVVCGDYYDQKQGEIDQWIFSALPPDRRPAYAPFRVPRFARTLAGWLNLLVDAGFVLEAFAEPRADEETAERCPLVAETRRVAHFLFVRCRKAAGTKGRREEGG